MNDKKVCLNSLEQYEEKKSARSKDGFHAYFENESSEEEFIKPAQQLDQRQEGKQPMSMQSDKRLTKEK